MYCDPGTFILNVDTADSFGDGWGGVEYYLYDLNSGALVDSGSIETAFIGDGLSTGLDLTFAWLQVATTSKPLEDTFPAGEVSVTLDDQFGTMYGTVSGTGANYGIDFTLTGLCSIEGCTDAAANNYNPSASLWTMGLASRLPPTTTLRMLRHSLADFTIWINCQCQRQRRLGRSRVR